MSADSFGPVFRLIVGLGNPGREYRDTRHNVGFMIVERLVESTKGEFRSEKSWHADVARCGEVIVCKPQTFMNRSGQAVRAISQFFKITPEQILIVADDMALPLGKMRFRPGGSSGGQKGLQSIIENLGTPEVPRLRIGIGAAAPGDAVGHVLGKFSPDEKIPLAEGLDRAASAIDCAQTRGLQAAMNAYN